jgi:hypothetical protein
MIIYNQIVPGVDEVYWYLLFVFFGWLLGWSILLGLPALHQLGWAENWEEDYTMAKSKPLGETKKDYIWWYYLVGDLEHFLFFHNIWDNPSHWLILIFFRRVEPTNWLFYTREFPVAKNCMALHGCRFQWIRSRYDWVSPSLAFRKFMGI